MRIMKNLSCFLRGLLAAFSVALFFDGMYAERMERKRRACLLDSAPVIPFDTVSCIRRRWRMR